MSNEFKLQRYPKKMKFSKKKKKSKLLALNPAVL